MIAQNNPVPEIVDAIPRLLLLEHKYDEFLPTASYASAPKSTC